MHECAYVCFLKKKSKSCYFLLLKNVQHCILDPPRVEVAFPLIPESPRRLERCGLLLIRSL